MTGVASVLWRRIDTPGHDFCRLEQQPSGWRLDGVAVFVHESEPASISYSVRCSPKWEAVSGAVRGSIGSRRIDYAFTRRDDIWALNGNRVSGLEHLVDLDFSFTPATNLTQLKRMPMPHGQAVPLAVAWFDLSSGVLAELPQVYQKRSESLFWYEAPTTGYSGLLEFDANGFICHYPTLWEAETSHDFCK